MSAVVEAMTDAGMKADAFMEANTVECCVEPGCGMHYLNELSECGCGALMCKRHTCGCAIEGAEAA